MSESDFVVPDPVLTPGGMPDITSATGALDSNARLIWGMVRFTELDTPLRPSPHEGEDGYLWSGKMSKVMVDIWPLLRTPSGTVTYTRTVLNQYLRLTHNMVCLDRGYGGRGKARTPLWWVRADWNDRKEFFQVTSNWDTTSESDREIAAEEFPEMESVTAPPDGVFRCDWPGCNQGEDGEAYTSPRANVMPLHRRSHEVTQRIVEATARILATGVDPRDVVYAQVARLAGVHASTVHNRFAREDLTIPAQALLTQRGAEAFESIPDDLALPTYSAETDETGAVTTVVEGRPGQVPASFDRAEWKTRVLRLAAFADGNRTPLTERIVRDVLKMLSPDERAAVLDDLFTSGDLVMRLDQDARARGREVWVAADAEAALEGTELAFTATVSVAPAQEQAEQPDPMAVAGAVDYVALMTAFVADYQAKAAQVAEQEQYIEQQSDQLASQGRLIEQSRAELKAVREMLAPLANFASGIHP